MWNEGKALELMDPSQSIDVDIDVLKFVDPGVPTLLNYRQILEGKHLNLIHELGSGPDYLFHAGETQGRAVVVKVFSPGIDIRRVCVQIKNWYLMSC